MQQEPRRPQRPQSRYWSGVRNLPSEQARGEKRSIHNLAKVLAVSSGSRLDSEILTSRQGSTRVAKTTCSATDMTDVHHRD